MQDHEQTSIVNKLNNLIMKAVPKAQGINKYGGTLYTLKSDEKEGQFCGIFKYKSHVQLAFSQGARLTDSDKKLGGNGKKRRHINIQDAQEINEASLKKLIMEAAKISVCDHRL